MRLDFTSSTTEVFFNPRINAEERMRYQACLLHHAQFPGHLWLASSGTSGKPKFAALSKKGILCSARAVNSHLNSNSADRWINVLPIFHVGGIGIFARGFLSGAEVINLYYDNFKWNPEEFIRTAVERKASLSALVPTQVFDLVNTGMKAPTSLRAVVVGGGGLEEDLYKQACLLGWNLLPSYGLTECSSQVATAAIGAEGKLKVLEHIEIKVDQEGFLHIKSPSLLSSYAVVESGEISLFDPKIDGWLRTEDKGQVEGPYLIFEGRNSDFLKVGGESVSLASVLRVLNDWKQKLGISETVLLFAMPDKRLGQIVALCIEGKNSDKISRLLKCVNNQVMPFERIREIRFVDVIPRNDLGKPLLQEISRL